MTYREPTRRTNRPIHATVVAGLLVVVAAIAATLGYPLLSSASSVAPSSPPARSAHLVRSSPPAASSPHAPSSPQAHHGAPGEADGVLPDGATVFDDEYPGIADLDPDLLHALHRAATDAADDEVGLFVESGWRSPAYQDRLLREAISKYGSEMEAVRWVATPETSPHVSGGAVDIGPFGAIAWLAEHGSRYGLCQIYKNEPWHFELRPAAIDHVCPRMYADPTHDPRMRR